MPYCRKIWSSNSHRLHRMPYHALLRPRMVCLFVLGYPGCPGMRLLNEFHCYYASINRIGGAGGIMFLCCPSVCVYVRPCVCRGILCLACRRLLVISVRDLWHASVLLQVQSRVIESLPDILSLNCQLEHSKDVEFWRKQEEVNLVCLRLLVYRIHLDKFSYFKLFALLYKL